MNGGLEQALAAVREAWRNGLENGCQNFFASSTDEEIAIDMMDCDAHIECLAFPDVLNAVKRVRAENA